MWLKCGILKANQSQKEQKNKGYSYEVISLEDNSAPYVANVNIYNEGKTSVVQYKLSFDEDSNMQLCYPETNQNFKLEF